MLSATNFQLLRVDISGNGNGAWIDLGPSSGVLHFVAGIYVSGGTVSLKAELQHSPTPSDTYATTFKNFNLNSATITEEGWYPISIISPIERYIRVNVNSYGSGTVKAQDETRIKIYSDGILQVKYV